MSDMEIYHHLATRISWTRITRSMDSRLRIIGRFPFSWAVPGQNFQLEANHGSTTNSPFIDLWCHPHRTQHLKG